jgi:glycine cleavage system H protein
LKYSKEHEWARIEGQRATVGITDYAQGQLGDVVFVELPEVGASVSQFAQFGMIESVKAASDLFSPLAGVVKAVNIKLAEHPELVNQDPYGEGWMLEVELADADQLANLLDAAQYQQSLPAD